MKSRSFFAVCVGSLLAPAAFPAVGLGAGASARAIIHDAGGKEVGSARITESAGKVEVTLSVHGLPPGVHGFHIHEKGSCEPPDFSSAGGHFNPSHRQHGRENPRGHHVGDLPNLSVGPEGTGRLQAVVEGATLAGGERSLLKPGGTAIVIHALADDYKTDPAGNAGARIACGAVELEKDR